MGLQATVLAAVQTALSAIEDLAIPAKLTHRVPTTYAPGAAVVYTLTTYDVKVVISSFTEKEIEADRDKATDTKLMVFHEEVVPELNDTLTFNGKQFRVMNGVPTYAGSEIAFSTVQARPLKSA